MSGTVILIGLADALIDLKLVATTQKVENLLTFQALYRVNQRCFNRLKTHRNQRNK